MYDDERRLSTCPRCGRQGLFQQAEVQDNNSGCLIFLLGGLLPYLIFNSSRSNMVVCPNCNYVFKERTPMSPYEVWFIAVMFLLVAALLIAVFVASAMH